MKNQRRNFLLKIIAAFVVITWLVNSPANTLADVPDEPFIEFSANPTTIRVGECTTIHWDTANIKAVYYNGQGVSGVNQNRTECPRQTTTYTLLVEKPDGLQEVRTVQVLVEGTLPNTSGADYAVFFNADRSNIRFGECVTISWHTTNVMAVFYNGQGVPGENQSRIECPRQTTTYTLRVIKLDNSEEFRSIQILVEGGGTGHKNLDMDDGEMVDFDRDGRVSRDEDDFIWHWQGGELGIIRKADDDDDDLRLAGLRQGDTDDLERLPRSDCEQHLDRFDNDQVFVVEDTMVYFRSDEGRCGKFRVGDIRRTDGRLELEWFLWE